MIEVLFDILLVILLASVLAEVILSLQDPFEVLEEHIVQQDGEPEKKVDWEA